MKRIGVLVGEQGNWSFFRDIYSDLKERYALETFQRREYNTPVLHGRLNRFAFRRGIQTLLKNNDLCFFEWASELLVPASRMKRRGSIVTRIHSYELHAWGPLIDWNGVDKVILVSEAMRKSFIGEYPDQASKTVVVPNAVDLARFQAPARTPGREIGMLASFNPRKRIYEMILTFAEMKRSGLDARLHIAGGRIHAPNLDEYYLSCKRMVAHLGLQDDVLFYEHIEDTATWLGGIDVFISNGWWEGLQVALLEALASGCYCLSHCWMGAEEALPQENIYSTDAELKDKLFAYFASAESDRLQQRAAMRAIACERFDLKQQTSRMRSVLDELIAG